MSVMDQDVLKVLYTEEEIAALTPTTLGCEVGRGF